MKFDKEIATNVFLVFAILSKLVQMSDEIRCLTGGECMLPQSKITPDTKIGNVIGLVVYSCLMMGLVYLLFKRSFKQSTLSYKITTVLILLYAIMTSLISLIATYTVGLEVLFVQAGFPPQLLFASLFFLIFSIAMAVFASVTVSKRLQ